MFFNFFCFFEDLEKRLSLLLVSLLLFIVIISPVCTPASCAAMRRPAGPAAAPCWMEAPWASLTLRCRTSSCSAPLWVWCWRWGRQSSPCWTVRRLACPKYYNMQLMGCWKILLSMHTSCIHHLCYHICIVVRTSEVNVCKSNLQPSTLQKRAIRIVPNVWYIGCTRTHCFFYVTFIEIVGLSQI